MLWFFAAVILAMMCPYAYAEAEAPGVDDGFILDGGAVFLMTDGTVRVLQDDRITMKYYYDVSFPLSECVSWTDITQLEVCNDVIAGLRTDGTVIASGREDYVAEISNWNNIIELYGLSGDYSMIAGLREDGRVFVVGEDPFAEWDHEDGKPSLYETIESWRNLKKVVIGVCSAGGYAAAVHKDGTVSHRVYDAGWSGPAKHVVDLDCSGWGLIALKEDGTCVVNGEDSYVYREITDTWTDLKQVGCGDTFAIGLRNDGTFVTSREDSEEWPDAVSAEFAALRDIDHFECSTYNIITAYRKDGTVELFFDTNDTGNEEIRNWTDIKRIMVSMLYDSEPVIIGIKTDGTLISTVGEIHLD